VRRQDDSLARTDKIASCADDLGVSGRDFTDRLAVVWVTKDDSAGHKGRVLGTKHICCVMNELSTLSGCSVRLHSPQILLELLVTYE
jgi:hypothetical protein